MAVDLPSFNIHEKFAKLKFTDFKRIDSVDIPSAPQTPLLSPPEPFHLRVINVDDTEKVLMFLRNFFFKDEPLNVDINLLEGGQTCTDLEEYSMRAIKDNVSIMAITDAGQIIGVCLNGIIKRNCCIEEIPEIKDPKFSKIVHLLDYVDKSADVFQKYPDLDKMILIEIISVDDAWRGQGIAKKMINKTRDLAREQGFKLLRADCTSHFSAKAIARLGFECVYTLKYEDYKENGRPVFDPESPHKQVAVYTQRIHS